MDKKYLLLRKSRLHLVVVGMVLILVMGSCVSGESAEESNEEETSIQLTLEESYDQVRNGARLRLSYDTESNSFSGSVENTTKVVLKAVRVEVHLSDGTELGPTEPKDLKPGEQMEVRLSAPNRDFDTWTAHPEVGESKGDEHGRDEGGDEHDQGGEGEKGHSEGGGN